MRSKDESQNCMTRANESGRVRKPTREGAPFLISDFISVRVIYRIINSCLHRRRSCFPQRILA